MSLQSRLASPPPLGHPGRLSPVTSAGQDNNRRAGRQASNETSDPLIIFAKPDRKLIRSTSVPFQFLNFSSEEVKHPWSLGAGKNRDRGRKYVACESQHQLRQHLTHCALQLNISLLADLTLACLTQFRCYFSSNLSNLSRCHNQMSYFIAMQCDF